MPVSILVTDVREIDTDVIRNLWMVQHAAKECRIPLLGHALVGVSEVPVVVVCTHWNPCSDSGGEVAQVEAPMFSGIATIELVAQIMADARQHHILTVDYGRFRHLHPREKSRDAVLVQIETI